MYKTMITSMLLATSLSGNVHAAVSCPAVSALKASFASANNPPPNNEGYKYDAVDSNGNAWSGQYFHNAEDIKNYNLRLIGPSPAGNACLYKADPERDQYGDEVFFRELTLTKQ
ncbi:hypothetical protein EGM97_00935 [Pseudomonas sp. AF32]|uniref:hypothetical protein n=1 Tax=Pseudomonas sp. AF32 TaxID=554390 RepID=UPI001EEEA2E5|nr:hypothetical protein [Pseudomonas sp. AF32]MCG6573271.1 hypothetical protein [Pseudomonas sp. AF32]